MQDFGCNQTSVPRMGGIFDRCQVSGLRRAVAATAAQASFRI
jgi:hypothetical protein